jgi:hypothetical protein
MLFQSKRRELWFPDSLVRKVLLEICNEVLVGLEQGSEFCKRGVWGVIEDNDPANKGEALYKFLLNHLKYKSYFMFLEDIDDMVISHGMTVDTLNVQNVNTMDDVVLKVSKIREALRQDSEMPEIVTLSGSKAKAVGCAQVFIQVIIALILVAVVITLMESLAESTTELLVIYSLMFIILAISMVYYFRKR